MGVKDCWCYSGKARVVVGNGDRGLKIKETNGNELIGKRNFVDLVSNLTNQIDVIAEHHAQQLNPTSLLRNFINVCSAYDIKGSSDSSSYFEEDMEFTDREEDMIHSER
ncbi:hypothetical protein V6N12_042063 [Hibiscus sabdariffa]|uniref:Uncharacterized protein n=1 Tax=Hibiscus sabdariffa TaxID=183260 RepID=A0ABR2EDN8_9ROSI